MLILTVLLHQRLGHSAALREQVYGNRTCIEDLFLFLSRTILISCNRSALCCLPPPAPDFDEPELMGDIAINSPDERNADPCTSRGCMWGKYNDGKVYVPYVIANHYCEYSLLNEAAKVDSPYNSY